MAFDLLPHALRSILPSRALAVAILLASVSCPGQTKHRRAPYLPEPLADKGWTRRVDQHQRLLTNQPCRVCFIGDSLTEFWQHAGEAAWEKEFAPLKAITLGIAGDRTEHILHRINRYDFHRANPRVVVLMMGTNNLGRQPPDNAEDVVRAIRAAVDMLRAKLPQASVLVLTIPPSSLAAESPLRMRIKEANSLLVQLTWPERVRVLDVYDAFVDGSGRWRSGLTLDGTHFSPAGYARLAELVSPVVKEMLL